MKPLFDLHTHTVASGHAYSTLKENVETARERGLEALGLSDHAPAMPGAAHAFYFGNFKVFRKRILDVRIVRGIEANITSSSGSMDVDDALASRLDYVIASLHPPCVPSGTAEENTAALVAAMRTPWVRIIGHPDDSRFPLDYEELVLAARQENVALELNNSSFSPSSGRVGARENVAKMLPLCAAHGVPIVMASDAHIYYDVGDMEECERIVEATGFPRELVLNYRPDGLDLILSRRESPCFLQ